MARRRSGAAALDQGREAADGEVGGGGWAALIARRRHAILATYVAGLLVLTLAPLPEAANRLASGRGFDKAVHFLLLGGLAALLYWSERHAAPGQKPTLLGVVGPSAALAALIELLQAPLPYRTADFWDFFWGAAGALAAYLIARRLSRPVAERREH